MNSKGQPSCELSDRAKFLWGKSGSMDSDLWLPLYVHLADTAEVAKRLWDEWVPPATKLVIAKGIRGLKANTSKSDNSEINDLETDESKEQIIEITRKIFILLAILHDIGKATPIFQVAPNSRFKKNNAEELACYIRETGLSLPDISKIIKGGIIRHALASFAILERCGWDNSFSVVAGAHHGKPPSETDIQMVAAWKEYTGFNCQLWLVVQDELIAWSENYVEPDALELNRIKGCKLSRQAQVLLTGLVIMADWIASDEQRFPLTHIGVRASVSTQRICDAWENLDLAPYQELPEIARLDDTDALYRLRFSLNTPRPIQYAVPKLLAKTDDPGIIIIEAPMGEGKTEAALAAMEILARKTGRSGVFFALPTQATSDGIFERILDWIETFKGDRSIVLAHGRAHFNEKFSGLRLASENVNDGEDTVFVSEWAHGRKRAILNDFVVGTIDQVLMGGLKQKHLMLRHLGLANKIVVLDECHAYDTYMSQYLYKVLNWLGSYKVPIIVLSATLPADRRQKLVEAYLNNKPKVFADDPLMTQPQDETKCPEWACATDYPIITYTSGQQVLSDISSSSSSAPVRRLEVEINRLKDEDIISLLAELLVERGCAGVIVNTVTRAQALACSLSEAFGDNVVVLVHSRFVAPDRAAKEVKLREQLGRNSQSRPKRLIVVGTQVLEQSLDIDFDVLITDICPMDLLIQRIGRLHRHGGRVRPPRLREPRCYVTGIKSAACFDDGSEFIYGAYLLMGTQALLPEQMTLPDDISPLVQAAYAPDGVSVTQDIQTEYREAKEKHEKRAKEAEHKAKVFQIGSPAGGSYGLSATIVDWLNTDVSRDPNDKRAEATVRDTADSVQVLIIQKKRDEQFYSLPWIMDFGGKRLSADLARNHRLAQAVANCVVSLPTSMCASWLIDSVIAALETDCLQQLPEAWQQSEWLRGELFLILDEDMRARVLDFDLIYDQGYGLCVRKDGGV